MEKTFTDTFLRDVTSGASDFRSSASSETELLIYWLHELHDIWAAWVESDTLPRKLESSMLFRPYLGRVQECTYLSRYFAPLSTLEACWSLAFNLK